MSKHTPRPWGYSIIPDNPLEGSYEIHGDGNPHGTVAIVAGRFSESGTADARLIAAAPDLLEACESMMDTCGAPEHWNGETYKSLLLIRDAIAKARGEA